MSIASAIMALSPWIYWKLDETEGTVAADSSGHGIDGTYSGDLALGVLGAETDTTAVRVYTSGQVISPALSLSAWNSFAIGFMGTFPASGSPITATTFLGIGDIGNPDVRGFQVQQSSASAGAQQVRGGGSARKVNQSLSFQTAGWHWFAFGYDSALNQTWAQIDESNRAYSTGSPGTVWITTDTLNIRSSYPLVISNVAVFSSNKTELEIKTIGQEVQAWPYGIPINVPTTVGTPTVDLQPVLNAQAQTQDTVDAIHLDINGMVGTTFPSLQDVLNNITATMNNPIQTTLDAINAVIAAAAEPVRLDFFQTNSLTEGPTCSPVNVDLSLAAFYGVVVWITQYPDSTTFRTPDEAWTFNDLAVIRFYVGDQLVERHGIHTICHTVAPLPGSWQPWFVRGLAAIQPEGYRITIDWATGVCGELVGLNWPF